MTLNIQINVGTNSLIQMDINGEYHDIILRFGVVCLSSRGKTIGFHYIFNKTY